MRKTLRVFSVLDSSSLLSLDHAPAGLHGFHAEIAGKDGVIMPATQHDAGLWLSGSAYTVRFDIAHRAINAVRELASVAEETSSWAYRQIAT